jgi:hypothetical protein
MSDRIGAEGRNILKRHWIPAFAGMTWSVFCFSGQTQLKDKRFQLVEPRWASFGIACSEPNISAFQFCPSKLPCEDLYCQKTFGQDELGFGQQPVKTRSLYDVASTFLPAGADQ